VLAADIIAAIDAQHHESRRSLADPE
jgi:hypothetical protein